MACAQPLAAQCPPSSVERLWRVYPIFDAPISGDASGGVDEVPYFAHLYGSLNGPCTIAINEDLIVAGTYLRIVEDVGVPRPFVWLHDAQYGLAAGFHDLLDLTGGSDEDEPGFANDITEDGLVVGGRGGLIEESGLYAFAWSLPGHTSGGSSFAKPLDTASNSAIEWSLAIAVERSGGGDPRIVGMVGQLECPSIWWPAEFDLASTTPTVHDDIAQPPDDPLSQYPVSSHRIHFTDVAPGKEPVLNYEFASDYEAGECDTTGGGTFDGNESPFIVGAQYRPGEDPTWLRFDESPPTLVKRLTSARAIASDGLVGGSIRRYVSMTSTEDVPAVWEDPDGDLVYASTPYLPVPASGLQATVEAVGTDTNCGVRRLAGWETGEGRGVVWDACPDSGSPPDWCSHLIRDLTGNPVSVTRQAFDLTESGFTAVLVSGWAQVGDPPTTCVAGEFVGIVVHRSDLDFDLAVGASDLAILLGSWTSSGSEVCAISRGDIDGDNDVDGADLAILFGDWDSGPVFPAWPCSGLGCESASSSATAGAAGGGSDAVLAAMTSLGFSSIAAFSAWADGAGTDERAAACAYLVAAIGEYEGGGQ